MSRETELKIVTENHKPKEKEYVPKIVVCPTYNSIKWVAEEFISLLMGDAVGICLITLDEAIEYKLPLREAQRDYANKIPHDIYLANTVDELIPSDYQDQKEIIDLDSVVKYFKDNPRKKQQRNNLCLCKSGKKYKNCCLLEENQT